MRLKGYWQIQAGVLIGETAPGTAREFRLTSDEMDGPIGDRLAAFNRKKDEAMAYAAELMNPGIYNWVKMEWVWL